MEAANAIFDITIGEDYDFSDSPSDPENTEDQATTANTVHNRSNFKEIILPAQTIPDADSIFNGDNTAESPIAVEPGIQEIPDHAEKIYLDVPNPDHVDIHEFHTAVMLLMTATDMSHAQYRVFLETMKFATLEAIQSLPASLTTLRERFRRNMPLMKIRRHELQVSLESIPPKKKTPSDAYRFEIQEYAKLWLADRRLTSRMHFGLGILDKDISTSEFYHGSAWLGSLRTSSGEYARLFNDCEPLLPSDCVATTEYSALRIYGVGKSKTGDINLLCKRLLSFPVLPLHWRYNWSTSAEQAHQFARSQVPYALARSDLPELVLMEDDHIIVPLMTVTKKLWVHFLDYDFDRLTASLLPSPPEFCVRLIAYTDQDRHLVRSIHLRHHIPAEIELVELGRIYCIERFLGSGPRRISIPITAFLDDFGLYRNTYHSLGGLYIQPANLDEPARFTMQNMFVLMLVPFGCSESEIAQCLRDETVPLAQGLEMTLLTGEQVILTVFPICITGDMPQQNTNSGVMSHKSKMGCRYCFQPTDNRGLLDDRVIQIGRYKKPHDALYEYTISCASGKSVKASHDLFAKYGITPGGHIFRHCFPMLDPFVGYPNDPMHVELRLAKYCHQVLIEDIFSPAGLEAYRQSWNRITLPHGWGLPQNPISHKGSMVFAEHGRIAQMNPLILLMMFGKGSRFPRTEATIDDSHILFFKHGIISRLAQEFGVAVQSEVVIECLLRTTYAVSQVIYLIHKSDLSQEERSKLSNIVIQVNYSPIHLLRNPYSSFQLSSSVANGLCCNGGGGKIGVWKHLAPERLNPKTEPNPSNSQNPVFPTFTENCAVI